MIASVGSASDEHVDTAIAAAREASRDWARTPAVDRGEILREVATRLRARTDELAEVMTLEGGKPLVENSDEVGWAAACFDYYAEIGRDSAGRVIPSIESSQLSLVIKEPLGVIGCIVPWNYPLLLLAWKMAPALAAGNALVAKPSELTPLSTLMLAPCLDHLPPGVVNLIAGGRRSARRSTGTAGRRHRLHGRWATGKKVARACVDRMARVNLEMGGKDPFIVCSDVADRIDVAAKGGAWAAFLNSGQVCTSAERFYVLDDVYDDYLTAFVDYTESLRDRRPDGERHRHRADGLGRAATEGRRPGGGRGRRGRRGRGGWRRRGTRARPLLRPGGGHRRAGRDGPAARGDLRPGRAAGAGGSLDEAIELANSTPLRARREHLHARTSRRSCAACAR